MTPINDTPGTPRDAAEAARCRAAYVRGVVDRARFCNGEREARYGSGILVDTAQTSCPGGQAGVVAEHLYPAPQRPRVVGDPVDGDLVWRVHNGVLQYGYGAAWNGLESFTVTPERVQLWADLLANPTEVVEDALV